MIGRARSERRREIEIEVPEPGSSPATGEEPVIALERQKALAVSLQQLSAEQREISRGETSRSARPASVTSNVRRPGSPASRWSSTKESCAHSRCAVASCWRWRAVELECGAGSPLDDDSAVVISSE
jgi:hypothetical protein